MDREILFKGKRIDNDGWVYGSHLFDQVIGKHYIVLPRNITESYTAVNPDGEFKRLHCTGIEVVPETVRQYTGLKDKNGKKIFEGDILRFTRGGNEHIGKVVYEQRICGLDLWYNEVVGAYGEKATFRISLTEPTKLEVIGNIYDNPKLLEVE